MLMMDLMMGEDPPLAPAGLAAPRSQSLFGRFLSGFTSNRTPQDTSHLPVSGNAPANVPESRTPPDTSLLSVPVPVPANVPENRTPPGTSLLSVPVPFPANVPENRTPPDTSLLSVPVPFPANVPENRTPPDTSLLSVPVPFPANVPENRTPPDTSLLSVPVPVPANVPENRTPPGTSLLSVPVPFPANVPENRTPPDTSLLSVPVPVPANVPENRTPPDTSLLSVPVPFPANVPENRTPPGTSLLSVPVPVPANAPENRTPPDTSLLSASGRALANPPEIRTPPDTSPLSVSRPASANISSGRTKPGMSQLSVLAADTAIIPASISCLTQSPQVDETIQTPCSPAFSLPPSRRLSAVSPTSPGVTRRETTEFTKRWIHESFLAVDPNSHPQVLLKKSEVFARYAVVVDRCGVGGVADTTLGKYIKELFPESAARRIGSKGISQNCFVGIQWADAPPPVGPQPQQRKDWGEILSRLKATTPTLRRVPRGARMAVSRCLTKVLKAVVESDDEEVWAKLLLFSYATLPVPQKTDEVKNLTSWVKASTADWDQRFSIPPARPPRPPSSRKGPPADTTAKKVEAKLSDGDIRGAIRLACSDDSIALNDDVTLPALLIKHPAHPLPVNFPPPPEDPIIPPVLDHEVVKAISTFPPGSAGGLDGMRPQILKDLLGCTHGEEGDGLVEAIASFVNHVHNGGVPDIFCPLFYGASLTALKKKSGGIRPIADSNVLCFSALDVDFLPNNLWQVVSSQQRTELCRGLTQWHCHSLGVGVKGGAEIGAHTARVYLNAFNEIRRDTLLNVVRERFPSIFPFVSQCYANPSSLFYGTIPIPSLLGCHQGDPLGPALFSLVIHPIVEVLETELNMWYLDDGAVADSPDKVLAALETISRMGVEVGLHLNHDKCEVGILGADRDTAIDILLQFQKVAPGIQLLSPESAMLLGAPLTKEAMEVVLAAKTAQLANFSQRLQQLSTHSAFFLLRASISIPRLIYFLRCAPSWRKLDSLAHYDATLKDALEAILNCSLSAAAWMQSSLPVKEGGLGIRHAVDVAITCFLASVHSVLPHMERLLPGDLHGTDAAMIEGEERWTALGPAELPAETIRGVQAAWERPILDITLSQLTQGATTPEDTARYRALRDKFAGSWLNALPSPQLGTLLSNESFRVSISLRLGCDVCQPHKCPCGAQVTARGYHGLSCRRSAGRWSRHEAANDVIARALRSAEVPCIREPAGCSTQDGKRPDGMTLIPWSRGKSLLWDFTCVDTFAPSYLSNTVRYQGAAASMAEDRKRKRYAFLLDRFIFVPVAMETTGVWGQEGLSLINQIGERITARTGQPNSVTFLRQRISLAVQRGNVASILGTLPEGRELEEVYYF
ncbi:hypothetical protein Fcan01_25760 [Folsomia candida]|uniref:RFX-type winged-helix domain-containing protein n=1 Tax=Folsomia candida TaxID=158441 RepID=A0A226D463_FOLCA|nr:hypothetical protein Fcan01_25760 [Folsomia candida]